jgi:hypothetical protein
MGALMKSNRRAGGLAWARRSAWTIGYLLAAAVLCCGATLGGAALTDLAGRHPGWATGVLVLCAATPPLVALIRRRLAWRAMRRRAEQAGWVTVHPKGRPWPWDDLRLRGTIEVGRAWSFRQAGFPVVAGEISWTGNALSGAVDVRDGRGLFVVVDLPVPMPSMAMRHGADPVGDSPLLDRPELRSAFRAGRIPPWTVRDRILFTFEPRTAPLRPAVIDEAVLDTLRVAGLLGLAGDGR